MIKNNNRNENGEANQNEDNIESKKMDEIKEYGQVAIPNAKHLIHCLNITVRLRDIIFFRLRTRQQNMNT